jgi:branched-chain amino acid transport system permease protein
LTALNFEIVTAESVGALRSGGYLLFTFLGGALFFFGPIIGAVLSVLAFVLLSELTKAWLLYLGLLFLVMVMFAPGGFSSLVMMNLRVAAFGKLRRLLLGYVGLAVTLALWFVGASAAIEMVYHLQFETGTGDEIRFLGTVLNVRSPNSWLTALGVFVMGFALFELVRRRFAQQWGAIQEEIQKELHRRGSV